jgi:hypothetical protein
MCDPPVDEHKIALKAQSLVGWDTHHRPCAPRLTTTPYPSLVHCADGLGVVIAHLPPSSLPSVITTPCLPFLAVQLLVFTGHPYLHLPAITLPLWAQLLRETVPSVAAAAGAKLPGM